ncbi:hypothetical protein [Calothrix sp. PCC 7507]|uniref:hypothetical protein n=1 Tax=Calothrix sp. PCC 7507 TaxID=99598 RepID=UPI0002FCA073|nr:hypothetical protein [Calothrix sp. PCC 7507]
MLSHTQLRHWLTIFLLSLTVGASSSSAQELNSSSQGVVINVESSSGTAEIALAQHLQQKKVKLYGAYWCSYCYKQIYLFGQQAFNFINRIECDPQGKNSQSDLCKAAKIQGYPTWEINGKFYSGVQSLNELAVLSGYQGSKNFQNSIPVNIPSQYSELRSERGLKSPSPPPDSGLPSLLDLRQ